jgi:hypothetical protein
MSKASTSTIHEFNTILTSLASLASLANLAINLQTVHWQLLATLWMVTLPLL